MAGTLLRSLEVKIVIKMVVVKITCLYTVYFHTINDYAKYRIRHKAIKSIHSRHFSQLRGAYLDLSYNHIQFVDPEAFVGACFDHISLDGNKISDGTLKLFDGDGADRILYLDLNNMNLSQVQIYAYNRKSDWRAVSIYMSGNEMIDMTHLICRKKYTKPRLC